MRQAAHAPLPDAVQVVYVSPLKALSNDIRRNLKEPLAGIAEKLKVGGHADPAIRSLVRTGDTPSSERARMTKRPPHILVTTPESLYILLTSEGGRNMLRTARTVIVDEIHAVADDKRGSHLSLSLERLQTLAGANGHRLVRVGLSATQRPIEEVARFLVGGEATDAAGKPDCTIVDTGHRRELDLALEMPGSPLEAVMAAEVWDEIYDRLAALVAEHETTLIFVNTRRIAERLTRHLSERIGEDNVAAHHGSLSREQRFDAEQRLKQGQLSALVATASLELGIDVGSVDLVCTLGSTRSIATLLQRVGRSGHSLGATPKGRLFPTSRDELIECIALLDAVERGELERLIIPEQPVDILAQQIVAAVACEEWSEDELYRLCLRAYPFRDLTRDTFDAVVRMLADGYATRRGRRGAMIHHDAVNGRLRPRRGARLAAITSGGAIPDNADFRVVLEPGGSLIGTVDEDFAVESLPGDIFQLGNASWRILRVDQGRVMVEDAHGQPPNIPFWFGEAPGRSDELSRAVSRLRAEVDERLGHSIEDAVGWLAERPGVGPVAAEEAVAYLSAARAALTAMPSQDTLVLERFFDEAGNQHLVIHSPFGSRMNRAWGLALRKRFCRSFNFELQAAATEDAIVLSLGPTHSFPAEQTFDFLRSATVRDILVQALLDAPMFGIRWRWNASRSLALLRFRGGRRVPPRLQRMQAEDLVAVVFPDQLACLENIAGDREIPDHPLIHQTIRDCLEEAMDIDRLEGLLTAIEAGEKRQVVRELREPSPLAHEILNARPYAFLDDVPLEERRTAAVYTRRYLDAETASDLGRLDEAAIRRVVEEAWPRPRDADELHDALVTLNALGTDEAVELDGWMQQLLADGRVTKLCDPARGLELWVAAERLPLVRAVYPDATLEPEITVPERIAGESWTREDARTELARGRLQASGPVTVAQLAEWFGLERREIDAALAVLEAEGTARQGEFSPQPNEIEWCERRLLARIHRYTLDRLRREIEPVNRADYMRFLFEWQRVAPDHQAEGAESLAGLLEQLEGFEAPAAAWEGEILPSRLAEYDPVWLDALCLSGRLIWSRLGSAAASTGSRTLRTTPIALVSRVERETWSSAARTARDDDLALTADARRVREHLASRGACFFDEITRATGLLRTQVEEALGQLVAAGLATADSFTGLRALLVPSSKRPPLGRRGRRSTAVFGMENAGRWSLVGPHGADPDGASSDEARTEQIARALLRRYGVVFRTGLERENLLPPWREMLRAYRRLEARGEIRGGRFVDGFSGEQFALPEAVGQLRKVRRRPTDGTLISISAADPLNLTGIVIPGRRVPALAGNRILFRDGIPLAVLEGGEPRFLQELSVSEQWEAKNALVRRRVPPQLRAYLGRPA